jgi:hypothetical protein
MRKALNDNPVVTISVLAVLLLVSGLFIAPRMLKKDEPAETAGAPSGYEVGVSVNGEDAGSVSVPAGAAAPPAVAPSSPQVTGTVTPEALIPGPGLPAPVAKAYRDGKSIVLLLVRESAVDDKLVRDSVERLSSDAGLAVFVAPAEDVARYSRITQGVGVTRVPALVVVRPRASASGDVPEATVSYGFRDSQSVVQAVRDAAYAGPDDRPYHPG